MGESLESGVESMFESPFPPYGLCDSGKSRNLSGPIYSLVLKEKKKIPQGSWEARGRRLAQEFLWAP